MEGQLTAARGDGALLSRSVEIEEGARAAVLHAPDLFRLDVVVADDTVRTVVRNLSERAELSLEAGGYGGPVIVAGELAGLRPARHDLRFALTEPGGAVDVAVLLATVRDPARGRVRVTAQARVTGR